MYVMTEGSANLTFFRININPVTIKSLLCIVCKLDTKGFEIFINKFFTLFIGEFHIDFTNRSKYIIKRDAVTLLKKHSFSFKVFSKTREALFHSGNHGV